MRIRTIKPEFWTSEDIAALDWDARLIFIGLWSYVDDNGVGRDVEKLIAADLFPLEDDPRETLARLARGLRALVAGGQITRYEVDGKRYLYVNAWGHQKIDHPSKGGCYPLPTCENAVRRPDDDPPSGESRETVAPVPGYRGTGVPGDSATRATPKRRASASPPSADPAKPDPPGDVARLLWDHTGGMIKFVAVREIAERALRAKGATIQAVAESMTAIYDRGRPITLESVGQELSGKTNRDGQRALPPADDGFWAQNPLGEAS